MEQARETIESCPPKNYQSLMSTQLAVYRKHIDSHLKFHPEIGTRENALAHFFNMFGIFFRQIYCGLACPDRQICSVRQEPRLGVMEVLDFDQLKHLPTVLPTVLPPDLSMGDIVEVCATYPGCHHQLALNAAQIYIARNPEHLKRHKYYYGINGVNEKERTVRHFLSMYAPLLRDMFCSAVCPEGSSCKRTNLNIPRQIA